MAESCSHEIDRSSKLKISAGVNEKWLTKEKRKSIKYVHHRRRLYNKKSPSTESYTQKNCYEAM